MITRFLLVAFLFGSFLVASSTGKAKDLPTHERLEKTIGFAREGKCDSATRLKDEFNNNYLLNDFVIAEVALCSFKKDELKEASTLVERFFNIAKYNHERMRKLRLIELVIQTRLEQIDKAMITLPKLAHPATFKTVEEQAWLLEVAKAFVKEAKADSFLRRLTLTLVARNQDQELKKLGIAWPPTTRWQDKLYHLHFADSLFSSKRYREAAKEYESYFRKYRDADVLYRISRIHKLLGRTSDQESALRRKVKYSANRYEQQVSLIQLGRFFWNNDRDNEAQAMFSRAIKLQPYGEVAASGYYYLGRLLESNQKVDDAMKTFAHAVRVKVKQDIFIKRRMQSIERIGWLAVKKGDYLKAAQWFRTVLREDKNSLLSDRALYWLADSLEKRGKLVEATQARDKLMKEFPLSFYGLEVRLKGKQVFSEGDLSFLDEKRKKQRRRPLSRERERLAEINERFHELKKANLIDESLYELDDINWRHLSEESMLKLAGWFDEMHDSYRSLRLAKFALNYQEEAATSDWLPYLYPRPYWDTVLRFSSLNGVDPYLVYAIMRQESEFNPEVISHADAYGLMQVIPPLASKIVKTLGQDWSVPNILFEEQQNIRIGTFHLGNLLSKYQENIVDMLASYNGGERALVKWRRKFAEVPSEVYFIEEIPYGETKNYVKKVTRNLRVYHSLYNGTPSL